MRSEITFIDRITTSLKRTRRATNEDSTINTAAVMETLSRYNSRSGSNCSVGALSGRSSISSSFVQGSRDSKGRRGSTALSASDGEDINSFNGITSNDDIQKIVARFWNRLPHTTFGSVDAIKKVDYLHFLLRVEKFLHKEFNEHHILEQLEKKWLLTTSSSEYIVYDEFQDGLVEIAEAWSHKRSIVPFLWAVLSKLSIIRVIYSDGTRKVFGENGETTEEENIVFSIPLAGIEKFNYFWRLVDGDPELQTIGQLASASTAAVDHYLLAVKRRRRKAAYNAVQHDNLHELSKRLQPLSPTFAIQELLVASPEQVDGIRKEYLSRQSISLDMQKSPDAIHAELDKFQVTEHQQLSIEQAQTTYLTLYQLFFRQTVDQLRTLSLQDQEMIQRDFASTGMNLSSTDGKGKEAALHNFHQDILSKTSGDLIESAREWIECAKLDSDFVKGYYTEEPPELKPLTNVNYGLDDAKLNWLVKENLRHASVKTEESSRNHILQLLYRDALKEKKAEHTPLQALALYFEKHCREKQVDLCGFRALCKKVWQEREKSNQSLTAAATSGSNSNSEEEQLLLDDRVQQAFKTLVNGSTNTIDKQLFCEGVQSNGTVDFRTRFGRTTVGIRGNRRDSIDSNSDTPELSRTPRRGRRRSVRSSLGSNSDLDDIKETSEEEAKSDAQKQKLLAIRAKKKADDTRLPSISNKQPSASTNANGVILTGLVSAKLATMARRLRRYGVKGVSIVLNEADAIKKMQTEKEKYSLLCFDIDGQLDQALPIVRKLRRAVGKKVMILGGDEQDQIASESVKNQCLRHGALYFASDPNDFAKLAEAIIEYRKRDQTKKGIRSKFKRATGLLKSMGRLRKKD